MFHLFIQHIINTIGTIDDLIEKHEEIIKKIEKYLLLEYKKLNVNIELKFKDIFKVFNGGTFKSSDYVIISKYKLITIKNIDANGFNTDSPTYIPLMTNYEKYKLNIGDILLTMTGAYLGRSGIVDEENCYLNQRVLKIESPSRSFLYCFLKHNQQDIFNLGKGSAQPNLSLADLFELPVNYSIESIFNFKKNDRYFECLLNFKIKIKQLKTVKNMFLNKFFG